MDAAEEYRIVIVGAGLAGLGAAIRLRQAGVRDFVVLERAGDIGGTWRDARYPGAACDVPGQLYAYSFGPPPGWTRTLPGAGEIYRYLRRCVADHGLGPFLRLDSEVRRARWSERDRRWHIAAAGRRFLARHLVIATGLLSEPRLPDIAGLDDFGGRAFHTARWEADCDLSGKRVAVIGTGASAVQCVPGLAGLAEAVEVFQRTAPWVLPRLARRVPAAESDVYRRHPRLRRLARAAAFWRREGWRLVFTGPLSGVVRAAAEAVGRLHLRLQVPDRRLRRLLRPAYRLGCKRVLLSNDYYRALRRPDVALVTAPITRVTRRAVLTADGAAHPADVIVFGTGFTADRPPIARRVAGRDGVLLADAWQAGMAAHQNVMVAGFPNMFLLLGPNSWLGHSSLTLMLEAQLDYLLGCLGELDRRGLATVDVLPATQRAYTADLDRRMRRTVWLSGGCRSWYLDPRTGRNTAVWPRGVHRYRARLRRFSLEGHRTSG